MSAFIRVIAALAALLAAPALAQGPETVRVVASGALFDFASRVVERTAPEAVVERASRGEGFRLFCSGVEARTPSVVVGSWTAASDAVETCAENGVRDVVHIPVGTSAAVPIQSAEVDPLQGLTLRTLWLAVAERVPADGGLVENPYTRWSEIDPSLPDRPIEVIGPPPTSSAYDVFLAVLFGEACMTAPEMVALSPDERAQACYDLRRDDAFENGSEDPRQLAVELRQRPAALAVVSGHYLPLMEGVRPLPVNGVPPTPEAVQAGEFPLAHRFGAWVKSAHVGRVQGVAQVAQALASPQAIGPGGLLEEAGLLPPPAPVREHAQAQAAELSD